jgi:hypothetical protein
VFRRPEGDICWTCRNHSRSHDMNILQIRAAVKEMYPNQSWYRRVDKMADDQVIAIYLRNLEDPPDLPQKENPPDQGRLF